jgi:hypothetical protein
MVVAVIKDKIVKNGVYRYHRQAKGDDGQRVEKIGGRFRIVDFATNVVTNNEEVVFEELDGPDAGSIYTSSFGWFNNHMNPEFIPPIPVGAPPPPERAMILGSMYHPDRVGLPDVEIAHERRLREANERNSPSQY